MSRNAARTAPRARRKSRRSLLWIAASVVVIIVLLYLEQIALLYVLATLSVAALLMVVAFADLRDARQPATGPAPHDDSAAIADGQTTPANTFGVNRARR